MRNPNYPDHVSPAAETLDDARGVIIGPMWARDEAARQAGSSLVTSLRLGAVAVLLVLLAYVGAAWLDEGMCGPANTCEVM